MEIKNYFAQDAQGNIMPSANCYLYLPGTTTLATGLVDGNGVPISNPFLASSIGQVTFGAPNGVYDLRISQGARDTTIEIQCADLLQALNETASFLGAHSTPPTSGNSGEPLQIYYRYFNTVDQLEYLYKSTGWVVNNLDGQIIATSQGGSLVGAVMQDGSTGTVQQAITDGDVKLRQDLIDWQRGVAMIAWRRSMQVPPSYPGLQLALDGGCVNFIEGVGLVTDRPNPSDPTTWDWSPCLQWAVTTSIESLKTIYLPDFHFRVTQTIQIPDGARLSFFGNNCTFTADVVAATRGATARIICDIPNGSLFKVATGGKARIHLKGIAFANINTSNEDCNLVDGELYGSQWSGIFLHSFHDAVKGATGFVTRIANSVLMNMKRTVFDGSFQDSYLLDNYINMSVDAVGVVTTIMRSAIGMSLITGNFFEFAVRGILSTSLTSAKINDNVFDYIANPFDGSGISGTMLHGNTFTHCAKYYAYRLGLTAEDPLRTTDWVSIKIGNTAKGLSIVGNAGSRIDILGSFKSGNYDDIKTAANIVEQVPDRGAGILWDVSTADIDKIRLSEYDDRIYTVPPSMASVSEGQRYGVGNLRFMKLGGSSKLITCSARRVLATFTTPETVDLSSLPLRTPLRILVVAGAGFSTYSYKMYDIYRDSVIRVFNVSANEENASAASSSISVSGDTISISAIGSAASKTLAFNFLVM